VGVAVKFTAEDDVNVDVTAVVLPLEMACEVGVTVAPVQEQPVGVTVTVIKDPPLEDAETEDEADVTTLGDAVGVPSPPVTDGKGGAELPTAEQMAFPAVLLDSTQRAPNGGWFRLSSQLPAPREVPSQRRMMGPPAQ
jgi:hypothetical protein